MNSQKKPVQIIWYYKGQNNCGQSVSGTVDASTLLLARAKLRKLGLIPQTIKRYSFWRHSYQISSQANSLEKSLNEASKLNNLKEFHSLLNKQHATRGASAKIRKPLAEKELTIFIKQLLIVIRSGVPLLRAFELAIACQKNKKFVIILKGVKFGIEGGLSLSEAFATYPKVFDFLFIKFVSLGEKAGILDVLLARYVEYKEGTEAVKRKIKAAMTYPLIILLISMVVLIIVLGFIVPAFQKIFISMGVKLPMVTVMVINLSGIIINYWWLFIILLVIIYFMAQFAYQKIILVRFFSDSYLLRLPLFGQLVQKNLLARWARTLALLFAAGIPLNEGLTSVALLLNNYYYGVASLKVQKEIESGSSLYSAMLISKVFPDLLNQMIAVGEEAGSLDYLLHSVADYYDQDVKLAIETLLSLLEPLAIIFLGMVLGSIIVAIYMPLFNLGNVIG